MKLIVKFLLVVMSLPLWAFFCFMTIPVMVFALPSVFIGNPLNIIFVIVWVAGGFSLYSGICAITLVGMKPYVLRKRDQIGIGIGLVIFIPLTLLSPSKDLGWVVRSLSFVGIFPSCLLLIYSITNKTSSGQHRTCSDNAD